MALTPRDKQQLKAKAHKLKPIILIGNQGLTKAVHAEIERALCDHELIKVRFPASDKVVKQGLAMQIAEFHSAVSLQLLGNICTLYRKSNSTNTPTKEIDPIKRQKTPKK